MGYDNTLILIHGVELNLEETKKLKNIFGALFEGITEDVDCKISDYIYNLIPDEKIILKRHNSTTNLKQRYYMGVWSERTDSRIHDLSFHFEWEDGVHFFGIKIGSRGYSGFDDVNELMTQKHQQAIDNFKEYCKPLLDKIGKKDKPTFKVFCQVH